jgi:hypothetical protein
MPRGEGGGGGGGMDAEAGEAAAPVSKVNAASVRLNGRRSALVLARG